MSDLREYISQVKKIKELKTIKTKVSTKYEIAGITAKVDNSHAVLFENIKESDFRLVSNLVGTRKRFALAVGGTDKNIHQKVISAIKNAKAPKVISNGKFMETNQKISFPCLLLLILRRNLDLLLPPQLLMPKILKLENKIHLFIE